MRKYYITARIETKLLDLLAEHLPSGQDAETVITAGGVWHGRSMRVTDPGFLLKKGKTVRVYTNPFQGQYYTLDDSQVIFEDEDFLAVYKPGNLNVHAVPSTLYYNLSYGVSQYLKEQGIAMAVTPATRLDRPVAGLVLFAKSKVSERKLFELVRKGRIKKWYFGALEKGKEMRRIKIDDTIISEWSTTKLDPGGKRAVTFFSLVESRENADIYSIFPFTGRRHQIRFHASHYLAPIIGDMQYGSRYNFKPDEIALMCRGYNFFVKGKQFKIRVTNNHINEFYQKIDSVNPTSIEKR